MSGSCGQIDFVDGGTFRGVSILNSQITDSTVSNSVMESSTIRTLAGLDAASAGTIANAIAALPADQLQALVTAIFTALTVTPAPSPAGTELDTVPTTIFGGRDALLGRPELFAPFGNSHIIALYRAG